MILQEQAFIEPLAVQGVGRIADGGAGVTGYMDHSRYKLIHSLNVPTVWWYSFYVL